MGSSAEGDRGEGWQGMVGSDRIIMDHSGSICQTTLFKGTNKTKDQHSLERQPSVDPEWYATGSDFSAPIRKLTLAARSIEWISMQPLNAEIGPTGEENTFHGKHHPGGFKWHALELVPRDWHSKAGPFEEFSAPLGG